MPEQSGEMSRLIEEFDGCRKLLLALGDETRQRIILRIMQMGRCGGVQVSEISKESRLSRPAVSHHVQILKDAGVLKMRREGTKRYYCFDAASVRRLMELLEHAVVLAEREPSQQVNEKGA